MTTATRLSALGLSTLAISLVLTGCANHFDGAMADAGVRMDGQASTEASKAQVALTRDRADEAIAHAEAAVALAPRGADYRALLGRAYLADGRFDSARQAFADALMLNSHDGASALSLALAQTASGDDAAARHTLAAHADIIPAADLGLATALAGDPAAGVAVLLPAARLPGASAKTRQNLALSLALSGRWAEARAIAALDLSPAMLDKRMGEWADFASPKNRPTQVASLLGVRVARDPGLPVALALNAASATGTTETASMDDAALTATADRAPTPSFSVAPKVIFAAAHEVVQPLPAAADPAPIPGTGVPARMAVAKAFAPEAGEWFVQLGAFENAAVARDAWGRLRSRYTRLAQVTPHGMPFRTGGSDFYRLSVGGFARADAVALCQSVRARGGRCFVRNGEGDRVAQWAKPQGVAIASR